MKDKKIEFWKVCLVLASVVVTFSGLFDHQVWTPDEPRVAAIIHNMYMTGNFIIPSYANISFVEKPPLFFIISTLVMHITPLDAVMSGRLALALLCLGTLFVTFKLVKRLKDTQSAWIAFAILATSEGFILNFHWLRVDASLIFFVTAAIWAFAEAYFANKTRWLYWAGLFTGLAFLSKGPVAIVLIFPAWVYLLARYCYLRKQDQEVFPTNSKVVAHHVIGIAIMVITIACWVYPFYLTASPQLWYEWFWQNQVGRFTGTAAAALGHVIKGRPFYYLNGLTEYTLPWTVFFFGWFVLLVKRYLKEKSISWYDGFLLVWFATVIFVFSYSETKRSMYLAPLMPLLAMISTQAISQLKGNWVNRYRQGWALLMSVFLVLIATTPLWYQLLPMKKIPERTITWLAEWHWTAALIFVFVALMWVVETTKWKSWVKMSVITALFFSAGITHLFPGIDVTKDMRTDLNKFARQVPVEQRSKIAGINFTETMSSIIYLFENWPVHMVKKNQAVAILQGKDPVYDSLLVDCYNTELGPVQCASLDYKGKIKILAEGHPRSNKSQDTLYWIKGVQ
ncbi:glycosyltransferase family 39 protein [Vibrio sp. S4M6]|uniref:ArnT family glycosyltransferase n=1 Tax=Vibrio sinus TaxID=2946865 RepID=UPI002029F97B|nr:glycosyltransferase family 39 protein [Vibrio sinus]MCL9780584.1 glycosyltransferase family 39 protein [Vibrio sinus]